MKKLITIFSFLAISLLMGKVCHAQIDVNQLSYNSSFAFGTTTSSGFTCTQGAILQSFKAGTNTLSDFVLWLRLTGLATPPTLDFHLYDGVIGSGSEIATGHIYNIWEYLNTSSFLPYDFRFSSPVGLTIGNIYTIIVSVASFSDPPKNVLEVQTDTSNPYPDGSFWFGGGGYGCDYGAFQNQPSTDLRFQTYSTPPDFRIFPTFPVEGSVASSSPVEFYGLYNNADGAYNVLFLLVHNQDNGQYKYGLYPLVNEDNALYHLKFPFNQNGYYDYTMFLTNTDNTASSSPLQAINFIYTAGGLPEIGSTTPNGVNSLISTSTFYTTYLPPIFGTTTPASFIYNGPVNLFNSIFGKVLNYVDNLNQFIYNLDITNTGNSFTTAYELMWSYCKGLDQIMPFPLFSITIFILAIYIIIFVINIINRILHIIPFT